MLQIFLGGAALALTLAASVPASRVFVVLSNTLAHPRSALVRTVAQPKVAGVSIATALPDAEPAGSIGGGDCTGTGCVAKITYTLTVAKSGTGAGTVAVATTGVTAIPAIDCGTRCSASFNSGALVTLKAAAAPGSTLAGWRGCSSTSGDTCSVSILFTTTVSTVFNALPPVSATTDQAVVLTQSSVVLRGSANPNGRSASGWFRYSTVQPANCTNAFGTSTPTTPLGSGTVPVTFNRQVDGLAPSTMYYYCALAGDTLGSVGGAVRSFTMPGDPATQKPDLTVADLKLVRPSSAVARYLVATVKNIGTAPIMQPVGLDMFDHAGTRYPVSLLYSPSSPLMPGASMEVTGPRATEGSYTYRAVVDPANTLTELQEQNNELSKLLTLITVDIRPSNLRVTNVTSRSATVTWRTNLPATGLVQFDSGATITPHSFMVPPETDNQPMAVDHTVALADLLPHQPYVLQIVGGNGQGSSYTAPPVSFTTLRVGEDLPDLIPQTLSMLGLVRHFAGYPISADNVLVRVRNASRFDAGPFGVWLTLRDVATGSAQCVSAQALSGLAANRSATVDFDVNSFLRCAPLEAKSYYVELSIDKSPVSGASQVAERNEDNNVRALPPFTVAPADGAPHALNFILRPEPARASYLRFEFNLTSTLPSSVYPPQLYYTIDPTDGVYDAATSTYSRQAVLHRDLSGQYYATFDGAPGLRYHARVWLRRTNVVSEDIVLSATP